MRRAPQDDGARLVTNGLCRTIASEHEAIMSTLTVTAKGQVTLVVNHAASF